MRTSFFMGCIYLSITTIIGSKFATFIHMRFTPHGYSLIIRVIVTVVLRIQFSIGEWNCRLLFLFCFRLSNNPFLWRTLAPYTGLFPLQYTMWVRDTTQFAPAEYHCSKDSSRSFWSTSSYQKFLLISRSSPLPRNVLTFIGNTTYRRQIRKLSQTQQAEGGCSRA